MKRRTYRPRPDRVPRSLTFRGMLLGGHCRCAMRTWGACWTCWAFASVQREIAARQREGAAR